MNTVHCAIYTRKSSEEGLEQDFNSLDAQREACAAYVLSQASEGWKLIGEHYDDGGLSGGTLERPALQRLLGDVKAGRVDIIVVYKVDRLTRSLLDFAKLVEALDQAGTSFVSVTQSFNTTTSMGRLTLNMLLSFAQFEREVTAERIRDKLAASKAKGMWMGGTPPLGYRPDGRTLAIVEEHAAIVRDIYARYRALGNVRTVADALKREGVTTPHRTTSTGRAYGGRPFARGQLYFILKNPIYVGDIPHKDRTYPGNHPAIIERELWDEVQRRLADNVQGHRARRERNASLLSGILFDAEGQPLIPVHTTKGTQRYRYYVSKAHHHRDDAVPSPRPLRLRASELDRLVRREVCALLDDPLEVARRLGVKVDVGQFERLGSRMASLRAEIARPQDDRLATILTRVVVRSGHIELTLASAALGELLGLGPAAGSAITLQASAPLSGRRIKLVHQQTDGAALGVHASAVKMLVRARSWWAELAAGELDIASLSRRDGVSDSYITRTVRLAFLAPEIVEAVLAGKLHARHDGKALASIVAQRASWTQQRAAIPFWS